MSRRTSGRVSSRRVLRLDAAFVHGAGIQVELRAQARYGVRNLTDLQQALDRIVGVPDLQNLRAGLEKRVRDHDDYTMEVPHRSGADGHQREVSPRCDL